MLFPFFRHTISNVRLAVVNTLYSFMNVPSLSKEWVTVPFLRLLFQNLVVEERSDIRDLTLSSWSTSLGILRMKDGWMESLISQQVLLEWYAVLMTPFGMPVDSSTFYHASLADSDSATERHPVDKNMLAQDLALVPIEIIWKARVASATALAQITALWPVDVHIFYALINTLLIVYPGTTF
jgi:TATA-binding protein-associated factor